MSFREFHNRLRIIHSIDQDELVAAGVLTADDALGWRRFRADPSRFLIRADDESAAKLWSLIERRETRSTVRPPHLVSA